MTKEVFTLTSPDGKTMELPVRKGTTGPDVIEIGRLYAEQGQSAARITCRQQRE